jgi:hypothetical protein
MLVSAFIIFKKPWFVVIFIMWYCHVILLGVDLWFWNGLVYLHFMDLVNSRVLLFKSDFTILGLFSLHKDHNKASLFSPLHKSHNKAFLFLQFSQVMIRLSHTATLIWPSTWH